MVKTQICSCDRISFDVVIIKTKVMNHETLKRIITKNSLRNEFGTKNFTFQLKPTWMHGPTFFCYSHSHVFVSLGPKQSKKFLFVRQTMLIFTERSECNYWNRLNGLRNLHLIYLFQPICYLFCFNFLFRFFSSFVQINLIIMSVKTQFSTVWFGKTSYQSYNWLFEQNP